MNQTIQQLKGELLVRDQEKEIFPQGVDHHTIREHNHLLILNCVRQQGPIARVTIAQQTGLSKTTVSSIIDDLLQDGLVGEGELLSASPIGGRRAILVQFNADIGIVLGVDVGRTHITLIATNLNGEVKRIQTISSEMASAPSMVHAIVLTAIRVFVAKSGLEWEQIVGIGIGIPSNSDGAAGQQDTSQERTLHDLPMLLTEEFHIPAYVDQSAFLGTLSEGRYGSGKGLNSFIYVNLDAGISCGIMNDEQILRGTLGAAGGLGHMNMVPDGPNCDCGSKGCLEAVAGERALMDDAFQGRTAQQYGQTVRQPSVLAQYDDFDMNDVIHAATSGDVASRFALQSAGSYLGTAVATMINLLNPDAIVFDGLVVRSTRILLDTLEAVAAQKTLPRLWAHTQLLIGKLGDLAIALGAATLVLDAIFVLPTKKS